MFSFLAHIKSNGQGTGRVAALLHIVIQGPRLQRLCLLPHMVTLGTDIQQRTEERMAHGKFYGLGLEVTRHSCLHSTGQNQSYAHT